MKKGIKILSCLFFILISSLLFSACEITPIFKSPISAPSSDNRNVEPIPSEISVEGLSSEIVVGEEYYTSLKVQQKLSGEWGEVVKADYAVECEYDGTKYGEYVVKVYLVNYPHVKYESNLVVKPLTIGLPSFTTVYTGQGIDVKSAIESNANGIYYVSKYTKETNVGEYSISLTLSNPDVYVWVDDNGEELKGFTKSINWTITQAPAKTYAGESRLVVYYGDTLYQVAAQNNLRNITWVDDENTIVTNQTRVSAIYNESPGNYADTPILIFFTEIITTANYTIEYYFYDGSDYVLDTGRSTYNNSDTIGEIISISPENIEGYVLNHFLSNPTGKVIKDNSLVLRLYYDLTN